MRKTKTMRVDPSKNNTSVSSHMQRSALDKRYSGSYKTPSRKYHGRGFLILYQKVLQALNLQGLAKKEAFELLQRVTSLIIGRRREYRPQLYWLCSYEKAIGIRFSFPDGLICPGKHCFRIRKKGLFLFKNTVRPRGCRMYKGKLPFSRSSL